MNAVLRPEESFDFRSPDIAGIFKARAQRFARLDNNPELIAWCKAHYRCNVADMISDWGCISEPRADVENGGAAFMPFIPWKRQREFIEWVLERWRNHENGVVPKSRDSGATWLAIAISCCLCMLYDGLVIGFGSRKLEYVDERGSPKSIFEKIRSFMQAMPPFFTGGWDAAIHSPQKRCFFPATGSVIVGEVGDDIGRGDRCTIYWVDEAANLEHPIMVERALSQTTPCYIAISTPRGTDNPFATKCHDGKTAKFEFHWRMDPRKDTKWYAREVEKFAHDPVIIAQELDMSFTASIDSVILKSEWLQACVNAHEKLGRKPSGVKAGALDIADLGRDSNAFVARHGFLVTHCDAWAGDVRGLWPTAERAFVHCDEWLLDEFCYDADGIGSGIRGDLNDISERRVAARLRRVKVRAFRASDEVFEPSQIVRGTDRTARDLFQNFKAQGWFSLYQRVYATFRAITAGAEVTDEEIISFDSSIPLLQKLLSEASRPQWKTSGNGKRMVDKQPDGAMSPNLADCLMMLFAPRSRPMRISDLALEAHEELMA